MDHDLVSFILFSYSVDDLVQWSDASASTYHSESLYFAECERSIGVGLIDSLLLSLYFDYSIFGILQLPRRPHHSNHISNLHLLKVLSHLSSIWEPWMDVLVVNLDQKFTLT